MKTIAKLLSLTLVVLLLSQDMRAQDPRFSQYAASPLTLNPAMTGVFNGNYRVSAIYRSQWRSILNGESVPLFRTFSASYDMRFGGIGQLGDAFGLGVVFLTDKAGEAEYGTNQVTLSLAYHKSVSRKQNQFISLGFQAGFANRGLNYNNLRFGDQFDGEGFNPNLQTGEVIGDDNFWYYDINVGLFYYWVNPNSSNKGRTNAYAGFSINHLNRPNQSFYEGQDANLYMKYTANIGAQFPLGRDSRVDLLPQAMILMQGPAFETNMGAYVKIFFQQNKPNENAFYIGPFYRIVGRDNVTDDGGITSEALIIAARIDYSTFTMGLSYDMNFSELTDATNTRGGFEISLQHVGSFKKKNKTHFCPRF